MKKWKRIIGSSFLCAVMLIANVTPLLAADKLDVAPVEDEYLTKIAYTPNTNSTLKLNTYLEAEGDIVSWLKSHEHDDYYLKTPYTGNINDPESCVRPRGEYRSNPSMNCTGFVASVMRAVGADFSKLTDRLHGTYANGCNWQDTVAKKGIQSYRYKSISELLKSGKLEKGDVLYFEPDWTKAGSDCHLGFFWGDTSSEDKFWHQTLADTNAITNIKSGTPYEYIYVFKTQKMGTLTLNVSAANGTKANLQGASYGLYDSNGKLAATLTVGSNNTVTKKNLNVGTYTLKQTKAPSGYTKDSASYKVKITNGNVTTQNLKVSKASSSLKLRIASSNPSLTGGNSNYSLEGAIFKIYDSNGKNVRYLKTSKSGCAIINGVPAGTYTVKMLKASGGYILDNQKHTIKIGEGESAEEVLQTSPRKNVCAHSWNEKTAEILREPNNVQYGEKRYTCNTCGQKKTELIDKVTSLSKPVLVSAKNNNSGAITVKWNKVTYAKGYYVYRKVKGGNWSKIATITSGDTTSYKDSKPVDGKNNVYTVCAYNGSVNSAYDKTGKTCLALQKPILISADCSGKKVTIQWKKVAASRGYYIYRKENGGRWVGIATLTSGDRTSFVDRNVSLGKTYTYTVRAYNGNLQSAYNSKGVTTKVTNTTYMKYCTTEKVNYRTGAGTSYAIAGTLPKNSTVQVVSGYSKKANGFTWYKVNINSKTYYMAANYLKKI